MVGIGRIAQRLAGPWIPREYGKAPFLWAFNLAFLFLQYLGRPPGALEAAALLLTVLLFLPIYFASWWPHRHRATSVLLVLLTCLLGALWAPHNIGAGTFFIFASAMCAHIVPARRAYLAMAMVLGMGVLVAASLPRASLMFLLPVLVVGIPVGAASVMEAILRRSREQLLRKQEEVEHIATIAERERISRDLHDLLGHTLSLITLKAELAGKLVERDPAACRREVAQIEHSARAALSEVRAAVTGYRQSGLAHELAGAKASLAAARVELSARVESFALPAAVENVLSLALREAVTNIVRHAGAARCEVSLALVDGVIVFRIADDGARLTSLAKLCHGNGLNGMHERIRALGGKLALRVERGLALELSLPMGAQA